MFTLTVEDISIHIYRSPFMSSSAVPALQAGTRAYFSANLIAWSAKLLSKEKKLDFIPINTGILQQRLLTTVMIKMLILILVIFHC